MKKRTYMSPQAEALTAIFESNLLDWSAEKGEGGGNTPESKEFGFDDEENLWDRNPNLWD